MESNRILPGQTSPPQQLTAPQERSGEEAFHDLAKSKGATQDDLAALVSAKTKLTRTKKGERTKKHNSLFLVSDQEDRLFEEPVYRTVMVDGVLFTLRLLAVA